MPSLLQCFVEEPLEDFVAVINNVRCVLSSFAVSLNCVRHIKSELAVFMNNVRHVISHFVVLMILMGAAFIGSTALISSCREMEKNTGPEISHLSTPSKVERNTSPEISPLSTPGKVERNWPRGLLSVHTWRGGEKH